jgi:AraC-like DNA-binding protein
VLHVAPGQVQQFGLQRTLDAKLVVFEPELLGRPLPPWPRPRLLTGDQQRMASELIATLARAKMTVRNNRRLFAALVDAIVAVIDDGAQVADDLYARFLVALEREHARTREVAAYAAILKCSSRTLGRACARATRKTVKQVIDERVALEARRLLAHGSEPAAAVGARLGFCEPTQFGKFFRRICGTTPDAFRKRFRVTPRR